MQNPCRARTWRAPVGSDPRGAVTSRTAASPAAHRCVLASSRRVSQSCYKVGEVAILAAPHRPGSSGSCRRYRVRERPVGWRVLPCPAPDLVVTKSPQPTPASASAAAPHPAVAMADPLLLFRWLDVILVVLAAPFVILMGLPALGYCV